MAIHDAGVRDREPSVEHSESKPTAGSGSLPEDPARKTPAAAPSRDREYIHYGGRVFSCTPDMAAIFLRHAREVIEAGAEELVPLLHSEGIELLFVSRSIPYSLAHSAVE